MTHQILISKTRELFEFNIAYCNQNLIFFNFCFDFILILDKFFNFVYLFDKNSRGGEV